MEVRRVGIYGGTFDPVHNGHLEVARSVLRFFELDEVIFVPACVPPHKRNATITSAFHRFAMVALATEADQRLLVSTIELEAPDRPYAVDTVERMRAALDAQTELFFIIGADLWLEITTWKDWQRLLTLCHLIVVARPGFDLKAFDRAKIPVTVLDATGRGCQQPIKVSTMGGEPSVVLTDQVMVDISATAIRAMVRAGDFAGLNRDVPPSVVSYIEKNGLYKN
ncbi:MAG TPA: nicotinate-nucleotide adenylyltransferase [Pyrinomonadaceae bacterium]|nr:nicotinate-nucleotide adenylyltransferase [Pyrinomonadaceae bacterium]